ncbi:hypothetical protein G9A89_022621 [Geosiphon pyriformis]|nr:hypothetical protein G9A89_022621 [Geosiphon pyriformis]
MDSPQDGRVAYRLMNQHGVKEPIQLLTTCPTMDLIAVSTQGGEVWIARWFEALEKIWTLPARSFNSEKVEALAWRPDGKVLAIGYSSGIVRLFNVDTSEMIHELFQKPASLLLSPSSQWTNDAEKISAINFLTWLVDKGDDDSQTTSMFYPSEEINYSSTHPAEKYMPRLSTIPGSKISKVLGYPSEVDGENFEDEKTKSIDLLVAGDADGNLHLSVYGIYNLESISLLEHTKSMRARILNASVTPDLSLLNLLILMDGESNSSQLTSVLKRPNHYIELTLDTGLLHSHKPEIRILSQRYTIIKYLINYIVEGLKQMQSQYNHMKESAKAYTFPFQEVLGNHSSNTTLASEFARLLATGKPSIILSEYIENRLTKRGLKDWDNKGLKSLEQIREFVHDYVRPGCERLLLQLTALVGYSKWPQKFDQLGLTEKFVHSCVLLTGYMINRLEELLLAIEREYQNFMEFQEWLQAEFENLISMDHGSGPEAPTHCDVDKVASYLKNSLEKDVLDQYFVENSSTVAAVEIEGLSEASILTTPVTRSKSVDDILADSFCAYPYDFTQINIPNGENGTSNNLRWFIDNIANQCATIYASTANKVAKSVVASKSITILNLTTNEYLEKAEAHEDGESQDAHLGTKFIIDAKIFVEELVIHQYVAFFLPDSLSKFNGNTLWVIRFLLPRDAQNPVEGIYKDNTCELACLKLTTEAGSDNIVTVIDLQFFNDRRLIMLTRQNDENGIEVNYLAELNYRDLNYISQRDFENPVEQAKLNVDECPIIEFSKSRPITQFRPTKLATSNGKEICLLSEDSRKILIFDMNEEEEEEGDIDFDEEEEAE